MNDKSHTYLHPATGNFSSLDLSLCHPSLLLDFDWTVSEDQHGSDHFPVIIESVNNSTSDHNAKWKLNKANWELYHSLCEESLKIDKFKNSLDPLDDFTSFLDISNKSIPKTLPASVAQLDAPSDWRPGGRGFNPRRGRQHSFVEIDHEIFSTVILSLPLIQEGQLSVSGERMCTILVNRLED